MLSLKYHITYWVVAAAAVIAYKLLESCPLIVAEFHITIGPLAAYTTCASLRWCCNGEKKTRLSLCLHQALVAHLLIALGSVAENFQLPDDKLPKPTKLIHLLSAFVAVGILESLRQDRNDIEPATFRIVHWEPRREVHCWSWKNIPTWLATIVTCDAILFVILYATDWVLQEFGGMSLRYIVPHWGFQQMEYSSRLGSAVVSHYLGGPFADLSETIFYVLYPKTFPYWAQATEWKPRLREVCHHTFPFLSPYFEPLEYAAFWVPRMIVLRAEPGVDGPDRSSGLLGILAGL